MIVISFGMPVLQPRGFPVGFSCGLGVLVLLTRLACQIHIGVKVFSKFWKRKLRHWQSSPPANPLSRNPHTSVSLCFSPLLLPKAESWPKSRMNKLTPVALTLHNSQASFYLSCSNAPLSMELKSTKCTFPSFPKKSNFKN